MIYLIQTTNGFELQKEEFYVRQYCERNNVPYKLMSLRQMRRDDISAYGTDFVPVGNIDFMYAAMTRLGIEKVNPNDYPTCFSDKDYGRRKPIVRVLGQIPDEEYPLFIKPAEKLKAFTGQVVSSSNHPLVHRLNPKMKVWACEVIDIVKEWRIYFYETDEGTIGYFSGLYQCRDFNTGKLELDMGKKFIEDIVFRYVQSTHINNGAIDIGVRADGRFVVIEANPGFSIGLYEYDEKSIDKYTRLLTNYWFNLVSKIEHRVYDLKQEIRKNPNLGVVKEVIVDTLRDRLINSSNEYQPDQNTIDCKMAISSRAKIVGAIEQALKNLAEPTKVAKVEITITMTNGKEYSGVVNQSHKYKD